MEGAGRLFLGVVGAGVDDVVGGDGLVGGFIGAGVLDLGEEVGEGVFGKKPEDRETDFKDIFDFTEAFDPPVAPPRPDVAEKLAEAAPKKPRKPRAKSTGKPAAEK